MLLLKSPDLAFEIPPERKARYAGVAGRSNLLLGLRPEHFSAAGEPRPGHGEFETRIDITEPVGIETFVYFVLADTEICARLPPQAGAQEGQPLRLSADLTQMHIIDPVTGLVV
jgi:multiple sugar transport system ATP-binding protein